MIINAVYSGASFDQLSLTPIILSTDPDNSGLGVGVRGRRMVIQIIIRELS